MKKIIFIISLLILMTGCQRQSKFSYYKPKRVDLVLSWNEVSKLYPDLRGIYQDYSDKQFLLELIIKEGLHKKNNLYFVLIDKPSPVFRNANIEFEGEVVKGAILYSCPGEYHGVLWGP